MYKIREDFQINYEMKKFKIREGRKCDNDANDGIIEDDKGK